MANRYHQALKHRSQAALRPATLSPSERPTADPSTFITTSISPITLADLLNPAPAADEEDCRLSLSDNRAPRSDGELKDPPIAPARSATSLSSTNRYSQLSPLYHSAIKRQSAPWKQLSNPSQPLAAKSFIHRRRSVAAAHRPHDHKSSLSSPLGNPAALSQLPASHSTAHPVTLQARCKGTGAGVSITDDGSYCVKHHPSPSGGSGVIQTAVSPLTLTKPTIDTVGMTKTTSAALAHVTVALEVRLRAVVSAEQAQRILSKQATLAVRVVPVASTGGTQAETQSQMFVSTGKECNVILS